MHNGYVFVKIRKVMHGPPQAVLIMHDKLVEIIELFCYAPAPMTPGLWQKKL